jgi:prepilin-type N-terminal cleavage/methylation domain-containing protein
LIRHRLRGFTLTEMAIVIAIVGLLMVSAMFTLSAQFEQRNFDETRRRLEAAQELLVSYALVNGRLPCPGVASGDESGGGAAPCTSNYGGFLPARTIGFQITDSAGFGLDAWGNRIRYAVSATTWSAGNARFTKSHVAGTTGAWSISQLPADLVVCATSPAAPAATVCDAGTSVTNQNTVVAIVFSIGKNGPTGGTGTNEARNLDANQLFVSRRADPSGAAGGEFDDMVAWIPVGQLYNRMIAGGVLP